jgi:hypothetical protein
MHATVGDVSTPPEHGPAPRAPKRGAFPTPKSEIDNATPYVPDTPDQDEGAEVEPDSPSDANGEEEG